VIHGSRGVIDILAGLPGAVTERFSALSTIEEVKAMAKPTLGFPTKAEAYTHVQAVRDKYQKLEQGRSPGDPHVRLGGEDAEFITALVRMHAHADKIIGLGIDYHYVAPDDAGRGSGRNGWGFRTVRVDGTEDVWSMRNAINEKQPSAEARVKAALRNEVEEWVQEAGREYDADTLFGGICFVTGEPIIDKFDSELHHEGRWVFFRIAEKFIEEEFLDWEDIEVVNAHNGRRELVGVFALADRELAARFVVFHADRAHIVRVLKGAHKGRTAVTAGRLGRVKGKKKGDS
jgi:hypothetical protein